jgi:dihydrodipicolinate synthase/N-acetylneuraminate lyase
MDPLAPGAASRTPPGPGRALAAAVTPLTADDDVDARAFGPLVRFLAGGGLDGMLALGTTGEGVMLSPAERQEVAEGFVAERPEGFAVMVHCGAQTTTQTVRLCRHAASIGAEGVAVIGPPYFTFDERSLLAHFAAAADASAPLPFYVYEFAARSGYAVSPALIERLRGVAPNLRGLKVSDAPFDAVRPYLLDGLEVFVGSEPLVLDGLAHGAAGAVSGLATTFPEVVAALVHDRDPRAHAHVTRLRDRLRDIPFHAAMKALLAARGVPVAPQVRAPLRGLTEPELAAVLSLAGSPVGS